MRTLAAVLAWLMAKGAPMPEAHNEVTGTPQGGFILNQTLIFRGPKASPETPWYLAGGDPNQLIVSDALVILNPGRTLLDLRRRGIAAGDPNAPAGEFEYPTEPPPFVLAPRARPLTPAEIES